MTDIFVNIHTHRPTGRGIELRAAGVHPWDAERQDTAPGPDLSDESTSDAEEQDVQTLEPSDAGIQAIGEIGLDFARKGDRARQYEVFRAQLQLARGAGLPVVIHCVKAFGEVMHELAACEPRAVIFHGFIGSVEQARRALDRGYYLSFGERTFASPKTVEAMQETPLTQLFFETDDSPAPIATVYERAAEKLGRSVEKLQEATLENYKRIFENG